MDERKGIYTLVFDTVVVDKSTGKKISLRAGTVITESVNSGNSPERSPAKEKIVASQATIQGSARDVALEVCARATEHQNIKPYSLPAGTTIRIITEEVETAIHAQRTLFLSHRTVVFETGGRKKEHLGIYFDQPTKVHDALGNVEIIGPFTEVWVPGETLDRRNALQKKREKKSREIKVGDIVTFVHKTELEKNDRGCVFRSLTNFKAKILKIERGQYWCELLEDVVAILYPAEVSPAGQFGQRYSVQTMTFEGAIKPRMIRLWRVCNVDGNIDKTLSNLRVQQQKVLRIAGGKRQDINYFEFTTFEAGKKFMLKSKRVLK